MLDNPYHAVSLGQARMINLQYPCKSGRALTNKPAKGDRNARTIGLYAQRAYGEGAASGRSQKLVWGYLMVPHPPWVDT